LTQGNWQAILTTVEETWPGCPNAHSEDHPTGSETHCADSTAEQSHLLFGSYARGDSTPDSDLDLMVILPGHPDKVAEMIRLRQTIGAVGTGVDVLVFSEDEALRRGQVPGTVVYWANKEGKVLYDATPG
jgi:uncharacterized protein